MKRKIIFSLISIMMILAIWQVSYAAIEIVPSKNGLGTDAIVNTTISNSYLLCRNMTAEGESLYGTTVVPHLATNEDWGAVSYLSNSFYGTNTVGKNTGIELVIDNVKYYSTTTNATGVMNWGANPNVRRFTYTAGIISGYDTTTSPSAEYVKEIYQNKDTKFVNIGEGVGMAFWETNGMYGNFYGIGNEQTYPISARMGLFSGTLGTAHQPLYPIGRAESVYTFRPVIWNE